MPLARAIHERRERWLTALISVVGTYDTKQDELGYLSDVIRAQGGGVMTMDVSVLGRPGTADRHQQASGRAEAGDYPSPRPSRATTRTLRCRSWRVARRCWRLGCRPRGGLTA
ncbi:MAG: Tm-1-like ATP-binding domain-containing protein [Paracoccaceae bacterium]